MVRRRQITSYDVARHAGVSQATVSIVLNNKEGNVRISEETRRRVLAAAEELHYSPNRLAQGLRRQKSGIIGFIPVVFYRKHDERPLPTMQLLHLNLARAALEHGYQIIEAPAVSATARHSDELVRFMLGQRVDGVILDRPETAAEVQSFVDHGLPVVQLRVPQFSCPTATVIADPAPGTDAAIDHLVGLGHRRIAFTGMQSENRIDRLRLDSFLAAMDRHRLAVPPEYIQLGETTVVARGESLADALLALAERPTAIVTATEALALGALRSLYKARIRVPDEMSVVSSNDALAVHFYPPLTSISTPLQEMARQALTLLTEQLADGDGEEKPRQVVLPTGFVVRESTQAPPRSVADQPRRAARGIVGESPER